MVSLAQMPTPTQLAKWLILKTIFDFLLVGRLGSMMANLVSLLLSTCFACLLSSDKPIDFPFKIYENLYLKNYFLIYLSII